MGKNVKSIFITGTNTGVGKSIICGLLGRFILNKGYKVITQKWIQTGSNSDIDLHLKLMRLEKEKIKDYLSFVCPYKFEFPSSPHLAAKLERKRINIEKIKKSFWLLQENFDYLIVEGIGGVLVPISRKKFVIDIVKELGLPVVIVVLNKLGAINHTLLSIEAIRRRKIPIIGIIFNHQPKEDKTILEDNINIIKALTNQRVLGSISWLNDEERLYKLFIPIGKRILTYLT